MSLGDLAYPSLVYIHLLLFVLWLGADVGVFLAGQHFRKRRLYSLDQRIALLKLLVLIDMTPYRCPYRWCHSAATGRYQPPC